MGSGVSREEIFLPMIPSYFLDADVIMYAIGGDHPLKAPCKRVLERIKSGKFLALTNTEVLQEILHRYFSIDKPLIAEIAYNSMIQFCLTVFPITLAETHQALKLMKATPAITSRDAIHAATMINNGLKEIISTDSHFDLIAGIKRIQPA